MQATTFFGIASDSSAPYAGNCKSEIQKVHAKRGTVTNLHDSMDHHDHDRKFWRGCDCRSLHGLEFSCPHFAGVLNAFAKVVWTHHQVTSDIRTMMALPPS
eukprot:1173935-Rhodomonas_salina.5